MAERSNRMIRIIRLKNRADFLRVRKAGQKWATPGLVLQTREWPCPAGQGEFEAGVGFTTSKKIGNAVERNRARRRLKAAVDAVFPEFAQPHRDFVIIGRQGTLGRPWEKLLEDLKTALKRLDACRKTPNAEVSRD